MKITDPVVFGLSLWLLACGSSTGGTSAGAAGTSSAGTSSAGTSSAGTSNAGTSNAGTSNAGTSSAGTATGGTSSAGTSSGGTPSAGTQGIAGTGTAGASGASGSEPAQFTVVTALWIGAPDDASTTVVYVFSKPTTCSLISAHGWDAKLTAGIQQLEMKEFGKAPATYNVVTTKTPAPGEAAVNYNSNASGAAVETSITGGTVTLTALKANTNATGSYALTFGTTHINGTFDATYCAGGVEP